MSRSYKDWLWVPTLYFAEGIPYAVVNTVAVILYKRLGVDNATIAFFTSWLYFPWVIKALWSPIVDNIASKRAWIITMQYLLALSLGAIALLLPGEFYFRATMAVFWIMAFLSATHDIAADGFYMLALDSHRQSVWVGLRTSFYRLAMLAGQGGLVYLAGTMEQRGSVVDAWRNTFVICAIAFLALSVWHSFTLPHPNSDSVRTPQSIRSILVDFMATFRDFFSKPGIIGAVAFMLLYKLPEAMLVKLITPFLLDSTELGGLGLTTAEVGITYGTIGAAGLMTGGIIGGLVAARGGLRRWLLPMAWSMSLTCLTFLFLSIFRIQDIVIINICVAVEQFGYGFGATAYTLYLLYYSRGERSTSYYAICTGIMALGMMLPGMAAGWIESLTGYSGFFGVTIACCALTIISCRFVKIDSEFGKK